ncbi:YkgJ family cysteine cluster protein [Magnetospirillum sp. UT-4]|uniref:YkgJ family cysteine cluster protein n=1 Tax=Magnetospirillum sp. UT-4 TaxID=2681467 RepID=UPI0013835293|nr:YkgJ family cysteine cluster protein [Magnetospirillum sp. UT-4]CAA7627207.1 conserved hypothetical protein [Magnetospirillum sp. UT-4]
MTAPLTFGDVQEQARAAAAEALSKGLAAAARAAIDVAERIAAAAPEAESAAIRDAACAAGCGWCCHQVVGVTAAEEELLLEAVNRLPADARARIRARQRAAERAACGRDMQEWQAARIACPLLDDSLCAVHSHRPLPCRAVLSADAGACRSWYEGADGARIPLVAFQRGVYAHAQAGLAHALAAAGMPPAPMALTEALALAFD